MMARVASSQILKDENGDIGEHLRNHIHLTNCIHLKNHMHNKQSSVLTDRSLLMRDLIVLQRSSSLKDPSASPNSPSKGDRKEGRRRSVDQNLGLNSGLKMSSSSPVVKTLSDQLNEVLESDDLASSNVRVRSNGRKRRNFRRARRTKPGVTVRETVGNKSEMSVGSNSIPPCEKYEEEEEGGRQNEHNMNRSVTKPSCGIPFNWSRIHHRGKTFLDLAGRSLSCGMSDSKVKKGETFMPMLSDSSSSSTKSDNEVWLHDYSGDLGLFADDLLKNEKDSDFGKKIRHGNDWRHQSFTQKYTPRTFRDLVGQNLVVQALSNAVAKRRIGLLYVFHGPNGTGKSSCARIFARALNCNSKNQSNRNILEVGSVKKLDFEKLLDKKMNFQNQRGHLMFILDDCSSMSMECWNSLSKMVDRGLNRVVFILVCSNLDDLPHVIVSRCQKFFFPKIKDSDIIQSLQRIALKEEIEIDKEALKLIALKSDGSLRDAEMTLEQLSLLGTRISVPLVQEMVGLISDEKLVNLLDLALSADTINTVKNLRTIMETGVEPLALMSQLATVITDILAGSYDFSKDQCKRKFFRRQQLTKEDMEKLRQALKTLSESEKQLRLSNDKLTWLTAALLQLAPEKQYLNCTPLMEDPSFLNRPSVEEIWLEVIEKVGDKELREFLYKEGKIFAISIGLDPTVELMFNSLLAKSTAENFKDQILEAFEAVIGSPVTLEIRDRKNVGSSLLQRSEIIELGDESESVMKQRQEQNRNQSIVRGKVSLGQVITGNGWSERKGESKSRSLIWSGNTSRKISRLKVKTRRVRLHSLVKLVSCGKCLST